MLRTNNKRLHTNLWTIAHFAGSALVFLMVVFSVYYLEIVAHGAYTDPATAITSTTPKIQFSWLNALVSSQGFSPVLPVTQMVKYVIPWGVSNNPLTGIPYCFSIGLDFVLWFNVALWTLQILVFVPDACFHWLEKKKEN